MKPLVTQGIILRRTNYGEADRIVTVLTPDQGKLRLMARGVRKVKSKLAGGIELFSVSDITFIKGRGEIDTLVSTRLSRHYGHIVGHLNRVQLGYDLIKLLDKATEDNPEPVYFDLLQQTFQALDDERIDLELIRTWFDAQLLKLGGHTPNLRTDLTGQPLNSTDTYGFDIESAVFTQQSNGRFAADHIKALRLLFDDHTPMQLIKVQDLLPAITNVLPLVRTMRATFIHDSM